jgi:hypothetical protein
MFVELVHVCRTCPCLLNLSILVLNSTHCCVELLNLSMFVELVHVCRTCPCLSNLSIFVELVHFCGLCAQLWTSLTHADRGVAIRAIPFFAPTPTTSVSRLEQCPEDRLKATSTSKVLLLEGIKLFVLFHSGNPKSESLVKNTYHPQQSGVCASFSCLSVVVCMLSVCFPLPLRDGDEESVTVFFGVRESAGVCPKKRSC